MRNLKRVLSLALALVMVLGMMVITTSAAAYTDAEEITYTEAVEVMSALGILNGNPDGTFAPKGTLTREQAAKILAYVCLGAEADEYLTGSAAPFDDVAATKWSAKYVAYCKNLGIIAGVGDNKFNPAGTLTTVQFAKMLLVAAGIDGTYTGAGWENNVKTAAKDAGLDVIDIDNSEITREEACEMALAAMKYAPESAGWAVKSGNTVLKTFADEVDAIVYKATMAALEIENLSVAPVAATGYLLDEVYDVTYGDSVDAFKRPGIRYTDGEDINLFYADAAMKTYTNSFNTTVVEALEEAEYVLDGAEIWYNGERLAKGYDQPNTPATVEDFVGNTATNGYVVELYGARKVVSKIVVTEYYMAQVGEITEAEGETPASIAVSVFEAGAMSNNPASDPIALTIVDDDEKTTDAYDVLAAYEEDAYIAICVKQGYEEAEDAAACVLDVKDVTPVAGKISKVNVGATNNATTLVIAGTTYKLNSQCVGGKALEAGTEGTLYLDAQGYGLGWVDKVVRTEIKYAYVLAMDTETVQAGLFETENTETVYAKLLYADGTVEIVPTTEANEDKAGTVVKYAAGTGRDAGKTVLTVDEGTWDSNGERTVTKSTAFQQGQTYNNKTVFVVETAHATIPNKMVYTVYTGITNIPTFTADEIACTYVPNATWTVSVCFAIGAELEVAGPAATDGLAYLVANNTLVKEVVGEGDDAEVIEYYTYNAIIDGKITTVNVGVNDSDEALVAAGALYSKLTYVDGLVIDKTDVSYTNGLAAVSGEGTAAAKDGVIVLGGQSYLYNDATVVYKVANGVITESSIGALKVDANDTVVGYTTNNMLTMIVVTTVPNA